MRPASDRLGQPVHARTASSGLRVRTEAATALAVNTEPRISTRSISNRVFWSMALEMSSAAPLRDHISASCSCGRPYFPAGSLTVTAGGDDPSVMSTCRPVRW